MNNALSTVINIANIAFSANVVTHVDFYKQENPVSIVLPSQPAKIMSDPLITQSLFATDFYELYVKPARIIDDNQIALAFNEAGINLTEGYNLIEIAKGVLAEMHYSNVGVSQCLVTDPEERSSHLTIKLMVTASFDESLTLDSKLSRELFNRAENIPYNLSFAVYPEE